MNKLDGLRKLPYAFTDESYSIPKNDFPKPSKKQIKQLKIAAENGDTDSKIRLHAYEILIPDIQKKIKIRALKELELLAIKNNIPAMHIVSEAYDLGYIDLPNKPEAAKWYAKLAELNDPIGLTNLGYMYEKGEGVEQDFEIAFNLTKAAAEQGHGQALHNLGLHYENGIHVEVNLEKSIECFTDAISNGFNISRHNLAYLYQNNKNLNIKPEEYFELYLECAKSGYAYSMKHVASCYIFGDGCEQNYEKAFYWLSLCEEAGHNEGLSDLGHMYNLGLGVKKDRSKAIDYFIKSAISGRIDGAVNIFANMPISVSGILPKDLSYHYSYLFSTEYEIPSGHYNLAICKLFGIECEPNHDEYKALIQKAINQGHTLANLTKPLLDLFIESVINQDTLVEAILLLAMLEETISGIKNEHRVCDEEIELAHFTTLEAIHSIGNTEKNSNHLRKYNVSYMNDPEEGIQLIINGDHSTRLRSLLFDTEKQENINTHQIPWNSSEYSVYMCSLTKRVDRLDLWRAYGRDGNGYCIVTPAKAFLKPLKSAFFQTTDNGSLTVGKNLLSEALHGTDSPIYEIRYGNEEINRTLLALEKPISELNNFILNKEPKIQNTIRKICRVICAELLYLYKSEEYSSEQEVRILEIQPITSNEIFPDERTPPRLYTKTENIIFTTQGSKIIIGPKIQQKIEAELDIKFRLAKKSWIQTTSVEHSKVMYR